MKPRMQQLSLAICFGLAAASATAEPATHQFNIPPQALGTALRAIANQSGAQMLYSESLMAGKHSQGLSGSYTTEQAVEKLLAGSGLTPKVAESGTVTITPAASQLNQSNPTSLPPVKVVGSAVYDVKDPYNEDYVIPSATAGTKTDTPIMETPLNVQSISKQVLKDQQVITLDQALKNVSGVTTQTGNFGQNNLFLRGFQTSTLFRNGFRMDSESTAGNAQGFGNGQQFSNVESVEVLKGPAAILYGRVEPGGMVNIITKQPRATPYYAFNQQFGSYDLYRTSIDATGPLTKDDTLLYRVNASFQNNNSFRDLVKNEDVFVAPIIRWNISPRTQATLEMEYQHQVTNQDQQVLPLVNNQLLDTISHKVNLGERNSVENENIFAGFNWSHQFNDDWVVKHMVNFKRQEQLMGIMAFPQSFSLPDNQVGRQLTDGFSRLDTIATDLNLTGHFKTWALEHTVLFGGDFYDFNIKAGQAFSSSDPANFSFISSINPVHPGTSATIDPSTKFSFITNVDNYGLYAQDQIKLPYNVHVMGGLRYQYVHSNIKLAGADNVFLSSSSAPPQTDDAVTPRVGILWNPDKRLSLYSNYAENFGANTGAFGFGGTVNSVKLLPAQTAQQWEVGAKTELFDGRLRATFAYYDLTKQNVATQDPAHRFDCGGNGCSVAVGAVRSRGPELDIQGEILPGWNVIANYTNQDVRITKSNETAETNNSFLVGQRLQYVPRNVANIWTTYEVQQGDLKGFKIGGGVRMQDGMVDSTNTVKASGYALVGLMTGYSFNVKKAKITAQLNVENLLDKSYFTNPTPQPGLGLGFVNFSTPRTFMGSINVQY